VSFPERLGRSELPVYPLRKLIMAHYGEAMRRAASEQALSREELLNYIANIHRLDLRPLQAILNQTEAIGDPALPEPPQIAILEWLGEAFDRWRREYPLEQPLADKLRSLLPMASALAITDPGFLTPGQHPLHRILDTVQEYGIGWQTSLGRAGSSLEKHVDAAIERCSGWFGHFKVDLESIAGELADAAERDMSRAKRMTQRMVDSELGQQRAADARRDAARMINAALMQHRATREAGAFLKGPWYESAQLVLLKFGDDSEEWRRMSEVSGTLLRSLQPGGIGRETLFDLVSTLPTELKRWLLSLQHDPAAADQAVKPLEAAHLQLMRGGDLALQNIDPILVPESRKRPMNAPPAAIQSLPTGRWYRVQTGPDEVLRVQLALKLDAEQLLLFVNLAGVKALQLDYGEFARMLDQRRAIPLRSGSSFSRCLVRAAGIETDQAFAELAEEERRRRQQRLEAEERELLQQREALAEQERLRRAAEQQAQLQSEREQRERLDRAALAERHEREQAEREEWEATERQAREAAQLREREQAERQAREQAERREREARERAEQDALERALQELEGGAETVPAEQPAEEPAEDSPGSEARLAVEADSQLTLSEEAELLLQGRDDGEGVARTSGSDELTAQASETPPGGPPPVAPSPLEPEPQSAQEQAGAPALGIPMGAWLVFHDGDAPLMAKLAVHDPEQDLYIFVNREGIKMRQLSGNELRRLMAANLVDVLETRTSFRGEVRRAREGDDN
jgi:hypothetical protein